MFLDQDSHFFFYNFIMFELNSFVVGYESRQKYQAGQSTYEYYLVKFKFAGLESVLKGGRGGA